MIAQKNASRILLSRNRTISLTTFACTIIDRAEATYGYDIPDFRAELVAELKSKWPYWKPAWVDLPSEGTAVDGTTMSLMALIRMAYASYRPGWVIAPVVENGRATGVWRITDDLNELREYFGITITDNLARFSHDMEVTSLMASSAFEEDALMQFFLSGAKQWHKDLVRLWNSTVRTSDDISTKSIPWLERNFGWQDINDAIDTLEVRSGVRGRACREIGEALWLQYDKKVP